MISVRTVTASKTATSTKNQNILPYLQVSASQESNVLPMLRLHLTRQARPNACMPKMISLQGQMHQPRKTEKKGSEAKAQAITALLRTPRNARTEPTSNQLHVCSPRPRSMSTLSWHTDSRLPPARMRLGVTVTCPLLETRLIYSNR